MNLNSVDTLTRIQQLLPPGTIIFWEGEPYGNPEPNAFIVLEAGFDTPEYRWGQKRVNQKLDRIRIVALTTFLRESLIQAVFDALPGEEFEVTSVSRSRNPIGDPPNARFEAVMNINSAS